MEKIKVTIHWFRRDLRLSDNAALYKALCSGLPVIPLFIFDRQIIDSLHQPGYPEVLTADRRVDFIHRALKALESNIRLYGSALITAYGEPVAVFKKLMSLFEIDSVFCNNDYEPSAIERDLSIEELLSNNKTKFIRCKDQVIFEKDEILKKDGSPYTVYTPYSKKWIERVKESELSALTPFPSQNILKNLIEERFFSSIKAQQISDPYKKRAYESSTTYLQQGVISLNFIGFCETDLSVSGVLLPWEGSLMTDYSGQLLDKDKIGNYHETRDIPSLNGTSLLSTHLRFGTISVRGVAQEALNSNPVWLGEIIWREFFKMILYHFPYVTDSPFKQKYRFIQWRNDASELERWCMGLTGYPIVDAGMRELYNTGLMHNRVRMITASFLVKHLLIDWRVGEAWFAERLLDYELSSNNGNWQWVAGCGCDAAPYFRIFNPWEQTKRFDPEMNYIRKWVPEAVNNDSYSIANNYPAPIIEHKKARERALEVFGNSLRVGPAE